MKSVLWVEDDAAELRGLMLSTARSGISIEVAMTYTDAIKALESSTYDAFVIDLIFPYSYDPAPDDCPIVGDDYLGIQPLGLSLIEEIKARNLKVPIIVLTVVSDKRVLDILSSLGVTRVLRKSHLLPSQVRDVVVEAVSE